MAITERRMTLEEFLKLPEEEPALELINGVVSQKVAPQFRHGLLQSTTVERINRFALSRQLAIAVTEVRATFGRHSAVPDVSVYRWEQAPRDEHGDFTDFARGARQPPDIAIEIRSPEQRLNQLVEKCRWFVANGVSLVLLLDPDTESVRLFRPDAEPRVMRGKDQLDLGPVLPGFRVTVQELFSPLHPRLVI